MKLSFSNIPNIAKNLRARQVVSLYSSMILGVFAGIGVSYVLTHNLTKEIYGDLKFVQNVCSFVVVFVTFGFFYSGGRLIAKKEYEPVKRNLIGSMIWIGVIIAAIYIVILFSGSFIEERLFDNKLGYIFRIFAPFLFIYPFEQYCENMLAADNKIYNLSLFRLGPKILYLFSCLAWNKYIAPLSLNSSFGLYLLSMAIFILFAIYRLKPAFKDFKANVILIKNENRTYGFPVFIGALASLASAQLGGISIGYFIDNINVGYFSLALTSTMPLALIPAIVGTTFFREFANMSIIPRKVFLVTVILSGAALLMFLSIIKPLIILLYTKEYMDVVPLAYYTAIGSTLHGFGDFYNRFLSAQGKGNLLRNSSFIIGISNIIGYTLIVYLFGVIGAAWTKLLSGLFYFVVMVYFYKHISKT